MSNTRHLGYQDILDIKTYLKTLKSFSREIQALYFLSNLVIFRYNIAVNMIYNEALTRLEDRYFSAVYDLEDAYIDYVNNLIKYLYDTNKRRKNFPLEGDDMIIRFTDSSTLDPIYISADYIRREFSGEEKSDVYVGNNTTGYRRKFSELNVEEMSKVIKAINDCYFSNEESN